MITSAAVAGRIIQLDGLAADAQRHRFIEEKLRIADLDLGQLRRLLFGGCQCFFGVAFHQPAALIMRDHFGLWEHIGAVDVIGVRMRIDDVQRLHAALIEKLSDITRLLGERQRVHDNRAFAGEDDGSRHLGIGAAREHVYPFGNSISLQRHCRLLNGPACPISRAI